jgi:lysophospholipase L1-like esterase
MPPGTSSSSSSASRLSTGRALWLGLLGGALILTLLELGARALVEPQIEWLQDPLHGPVRAPNVSIEHETFDTPPRLFRFTTNVLGFRGSSIQTVKKPVGVKRIFFLGGSSTDLSFLPEEETFAGRVEARLKAQGIACEVANAGATARSSPYTYSMLEHRVSLLEPDLVLVFDGFNDLQLSVCSNWDAPGYYLSNVERHFFSRWLSDKSRFVDWIQRLRHTGDLRPGWKRAESERTSRPLRAPDFDILRGLPRFEHFLRRDGLVCRELGCPLVLLTVPTLYKENMTPEEHARLLCLEAEPGMRAMRAYNDKIREVARDIGAILVDLEAIFPKDLDHLYDEAHPTSKGCELIAQAIVEKILTDGKLVSSK